MKTSARKSYRQCGLGLVSAVFIIVVVSLVALASVTIGNTARQASTMSVLGARAQVAAQAGMERAVHAIANSGTCFANNSFALDAAAADFTLAISCQAFGPFSEGADNYSVFALTATASSGSAGSADFVSRTLRATITE